MPTNLLILPILAGYLCVHISTRWRFRAQALDGYRLLLEVAIAGALLLLPTRLAVLALNTWAPQVKSWWLVLAPPQLPFLGTAVGGVILGAILPVLDNRRPNFTFLHRLAKRVLRSGKPRLILRVRRLLLTAYQHNRKSAINKEVRLHGNALIRLLHEAALNDLPVSITLNSRKWYVGLIAEAVNLEPNESHLRILPLMSGYREQGTMTACPELKHGPVYDKCIEQGYDLGLFVLTLPMASVVDARIFDLEVYSEHFAPREQPQRAAT